MRKITKKLLATTALGLALAVTGPQMAPPKWTMSSAKATTLSYIMLAPAPGQSFSVPSGNTYVSTNLGLIVNVAKADITALQQLGCILLTPRNNVSATRAPGGSDDFTASYGVGSQWVDVSGPNPPLIYVLTSMTSTPGSAVWTLLAGAPSSLTAGVINMLDYGVTPTAPDATANAQAAIDAAFNLGYPAIVYSPSGFNFTTLTLYPGITLVCGGRNNPLVRIAVGPGLYTTTAPGAGYPNSLMRGINMSNCAFNDGSGLAGANVTWTLTEQSKLEGITSVSHLAGVEFTGSISGGVLTVTGVTNGTVTAGAAPSGSTPGGMFLYCPGNSGCLNTTNDNTHPRIASNGTGSGLAGTYNLSANAPALSSREMVGLISWNWAAIAVTNPSGYNTALPSAPFIFLQANFGHSVNQMFAGVPNSGGTCLNYSGAGIVFETPLQNGGSVTNGNVFADVQTDCSNVGKLLNVGSDNSFLVTGEEFDNYGWMIGNGQGAPTSADRNLITNPYLEGNSSGAQKMEVGFGLDAAAQGNRIEGTGNLTAVTPLLDYQVGGNSNCWRLHGPVGTAGINDQEYCTAGSYFGSSPSLTAAPLTVPPGVIIAQNGFQWFTPQLFASLPTCNGANEGLSYFVYDSTTTTFHATITGGSNGKVLAVCDGTNWIVH
jgi:hypothetical protein